MSRPRRMHDVEDGYITGTIMANREKCGVCGWWTKCIRIHNFTPPEGIETEWLILAYRMVNGQALGTAVTYVGIGCGCYAKAHRQIAHIQHKRGTRASSSPTTVHPSTSKPQATASEAPWPMAHTHEQARSLRTGTGSGRGSDSVDQSSVDASSSSGTESDTEAR